MVIIVMVLSPMVVLLFVGIALIGRRLLRLSIAFASLLHFIASSLHRIVIASCPTSPADCSP
jgi:hypothetical protein